MKNNLIIKLTYEDEVAHVEVGGDPAELQALLTIILFKEEALRTLVEASLATYEREKANLELIMSRQERGLEEIDEFLEFWERVEKKAHSIPYFFKSDYYKYKDAIEAVAKEERSPNWLITQALDKIKNYSYEAGD